MSESTSSTQAVRTDSMSGFSFARPGWARGTVTEDDARFLHELIIEAGATTAIEVGVASGCSSVVLLKALAQVAAASGSAPRLHAFDIRRDCYFAPEYDTGAWVAEHVPELLPGFELVIGDAQEARRLLPPASVPFAFIDGDHLHPSATLDFMALLPVLTPTALVVLHDVRRGASRLGNVRGFGPAYIVDAWPYEVRIGGDRKITAALRLPGNHAEVEALWPRILKRTWEACPPTEMLHGLGVPAQPMTTESEGLQLVDIALKKGRRIAVWGTGEGASRLVARLRRMGVEPIALVEWTPEQRRLLRLPVLRPSAVRRAATPSPLVIVSGSFRHVIAEQLAAAGWRLRSHYVVF